MSMATDENLKGLLAKAIVADYMSTDIVTHDSKSRVLDIVKTMSDRNVSSVAITQNNKIVGILTERDVVKIVAYEIPVETSLAASSLVISSLLSIPKNHSLERAVELMAQKRVRHLLVEDPISHETIGIITVTDLVRYLKQALSSQEAKSLLLEVLYPSEQEGERQFWQ
jgi:CBS domain-containing protein